MSESSSISAIQASEKAAEKEIVSAQDRAQKKLQQVRSEHAEKIARIKESLTAELAEIAGVIQKEGQEFRAGVAEALKNDIARVTTDGKKRLPKAVDFVVKQFVDHVGQ